jgi:hypothetical protein
MNLNSKWIISTSQVSNVSTLEEVDVQVQDMCFTIEASTDKRASETLVVCQGRALPPCERVCGTGQAAL